MAPTISLARAKPRLATAWFLGAGAILTVVVFQSLLGRFGEETAKAWAWLLPTVMPTLSLMVGVLVADALGQNASQPQRPNVSRFLYRLALGVSVGYLSMVALTILIAPFTNRTPVELMELSNLFLGPLQGLTASALGAFFYKA